MTRIVSFLFVLCFVLALGAGSTTMAYTPQSLPPPTKNVYETIAANPKLTKFTAMINEAGLKDMLSANSGEPVTVFVPGNDALENIPGDVMKRIKASKENLQSFVKYHVIAGSMVSSGAIKGRRASPASANGESLSFDGADRAKPPKVGDGELLEADIVATNGIVHIVSGALVPPSLAQAAPPPPPAPAKPLAPTAATPAPVAATPATTPATAPAPPSAVRITTSGVAKAPAAALTTSATAMPATTAMPMTTSVIGLPPPSSSTALPDTSSSGFELFGHKFGW